MPSANHAPVLLALLNHYSAQTSEVDHQSAAGGISAEVIVAAEQHGLSPLLYRFVTDNNIESDENDLRVLHTLALRHRIHARTRNNVLKRILDLLDETGNAVIVLKGAALSHTLYASPELRPMGDIDLLLAKDKVIEARDCLIEAGFFFDPDPASYLANHHHIAPLYFNTEGETVVVELHYDALSNDINESIGFDNLKQKTRQFTVVSQSAQALGHIDTLHHLCRHSFEPAKIVKLIQISDIIRYSEKFVEQIDWQRIHHDLPFIINTLGCLQTLSTLSPELQSQARLSGKVVIKGVGIGFTPLSQSLTKPLRVWQILTSLFLPSEWWTRIYYNVEPGNSLAWCRLVRHPLNVFRWLVRRNKYSNRSPAPQPNIIE